MINLYFLVCSYDISPYGATISLGIRVLPAPYLNPRKGYLTVKIRDELKHQTMDIKASNTRIVAS